MLTADEKRGSPLAPARQPGQLRSLVPAAIATIIVFLPIIVLATIALTGSGEDWPHLARHVLPGSIISTVILLILVAAGSASVGVVSAWLVVGFDFPFRRSMSWALVLPFAVPPYLAAYAFADFFHFAGPIQSAIRAIFGFTRPGEYWFPEIRSTPGAALVMASVLYPYVYMTTRVVFIMQGRNIADVARTLGASPWRVFRQVLLPVATPAIAVGVALTLMETLNDIGATEYLGVKTLTLSVYTTWLNRGSLEGAAQIAMVMMVLVFVFLVAEQKSRGNKRFHATRSTQVLRPPRKVLAGWRAALALTSVLLPVAAGFGIPVIFFARYAWRRLEHLLDPELAKAFGNSVFAASLTSIITVSLALLLVYAARHSRSRASAILTRLAGLGYALPGTILALGLLFVLARIDNGIDSFAREWLGFSTGLILSGTVSAVVIACSVRFLALAEGSIRSGVEKLPPNLDEAARTLGRSPLASSVAVLLPLLVPAIFSAAVLVFVDTIKELSATILLRPFGFNTLATYVYENASRGVVEDGALAALVIIATALVPVALLSRALAGDRDANL